MPYPRELLDSAISFHRVDPKTQATLRRSVSTAYYALFHFLTEEASSNWVRPVQRGKLARNFDHKIMLNASNRCVEAYRKEPPGSLEFHLYSLANAFCQLQRNRQDADYDLLRTFSSSDVAIDIDLVEKAFTSWSLMAHDVVDEFQVWLVSEQLAGTRIAETLAIAVGLVVKANVRKSARPGSHDPDRATQANPGLGAACKSGCATEVRHPTRSDGASP